MPELLPELQHIGLGPRTFKKRQSPQNTDCSIWMDTPADIKCKARVFRNNRFTLCNWFVFTHRNGLRESKRVKQRKTVCRVSQKVSKYNASGYTFILLLSLYLHFCSVHLLCLLRPALSVVSQSNI